MTNKPSDRAIDAAAPDGANGQDAKDLRNMAAHFDQRASLCDPKWKMHHVWSRYRDLCNRLNAAPPSQDAEDAARPHDVGTWLWTQLMDWCKAQHCAPATQDALFSIVERARKEFPSSSRQDSEDAALLRWCIRHSSWIRDDGRNYVSICVDRDADLSCIATTKAALEAARAARGGG